MKKILYHGSENIIERPEYNKGARTNDYGRGFYCTEEIELAKEWACKRQQNGYVNKYELDMAGLNVMNLNDPQYSILNWLAHLAAHRTYWQNGSIAAEAKAYLGEHFLVDISDYDIMIGYRADDSYFAFAQDFVAGVISMQKLAEAMHFGKLGEQIVLKSKKAFSAIQYLGNEAAAAEEYYMKKVQRERDARREYRRTRKKVTDVNELFMLDIMREGIKNGDTRLF